MIVQELRVGNIVGVANKKHHPKLKDVSLEVTGVNCVPSGHNKMWTYAIGLEHLSQEENVFYDTYSQFIHFVVPIPLTEKCLVKFGFEYNGDKDWLTFIHGETVLFQSDDSDNFGLIPFTVKNMKIEIKYVHQLQNLYFALTGEELEVKQP